MKRSSESILSLGLLFLLMNVESVQAQTTPGSGIDLQKMVEIPASPEAAGIVEYGNTEVNLNLGKPNITVPIYTHQGREMGLPILLSYDASGIKATQLASNVGLGWSLVAGGAVTRVKLGMADDELAVSQRVNTASVRNLIDHSYSNPMGPDLVNTSLPNISQLLSLQDNTDIMEADTQSDVFSFTIGNGPSGTIYVDYSTNKAYCIEDPTVKVEVIGSINAPAAWKLTDASGVTYEFSVTEQTQYQFSSGLNEFVSTYTSSWFLTKVTSANKKDEYLLSYRSGLSWLDQEELHPITSIQNRPSTYFCSAINNYEVYSTPSFYKVSQRFLSDISWNGTPIVSLQYSSNREDLPGSERLESITILLGTGLTRGVAFYYDSNYFGSGSSFIDKRLKLESVVFEAGNPLESDEVWRFDYYNPDGIPSRDTNGVDFWGYYNGVTSNNSLVPSATWGSLSYSGANREVNFESTRNGSLKRIYFPTGGYEEFIYEEHDLGEITNTETTLETFSPGSLNGGTDVSDPFNYNDDAGLTPAGMTGIFTVTADSREFWVTLTGSGPSPEESSPDQGVWLYIFQDPSPDPWDHLYAQNFSDIERFYSESDLNATPVPFSLALLSPGEYRFLLYNSIPNTTALLSYSASVTRSWTEVDKVGGLRLNRIESRLEDNSIAATRSFSYDQHWKLQHLKFSEVKTEIRGSINSFTFGCQSVHRYSANRSTQVGAPVAYNKVTERRIDGTASNGHSIYEFEPHTRWGDVDVPYRIESVLNGKLKKSSIFDKNDNLLKETENFYSSIDLADSLSAVNRVRSMFFTSDTTVVGYRIRKTQGTAPNQTFSYDYIPWDNPLNDPALCSVSGMNCEDDEGIKSLPKYRVRHYSLQPYFGKLDSTIVTDHFNEGNVKTTTRYSYNYTHHFQVVEQSVTDSKEELLATINYYPEDISSVSSLPGGTITSAELLAIDRMKLDHQLNRVVQIEQKKNNTELLSRQRTNFNLWHNSFVQTESVETATAENPLEARVRFHSYYNNGNPREASQEDGTRSVYLWGYNGAYMVAKIDNADFATVNAVINQSILDNPSSDQALRDELAKLRTASSLQQAQVVSFTFLRGVGVTSQTDPNGLTTSFEYDSFGRLRLVRDHSNNIINKYEYNYKGQ